VLVLYSFAFENYRVKEINYEDISLFGFASVNSFARGRRAIVCTLDSSFYETTGWPKKVSHYQ